MSCLLVGEGDFAHSVMLSEITTDFVASCLESLNPECEGTRANIQHLRDRGIEVYLNVDARKLNNLQACLEKNGRFKRIIFNFPHAGGKMRIEQNRGLLKDFFVACKNVLDLKNGTVDVALCRGQGGTPLDADRRYDDTWKIAEMAAVGGFVLTKVEPFQSGYRKVGYRSLSKSFNDDGALLHTFSFSGPPPSLFSGVRDASSFSIEREIKFPLKYQLHYSFWTLEVDNCVVEETLKNAMSIHFADLKIEILRLISKFSSEGRTSWCFELSVTCACYALSRTNAMELFCRALSEALENELPGFLARI